ncbi:MAG: DUF58 domain-containing protein [Thermodesulfobacteriota bacterium]
MTEKSRPRSSPTPLPHRLDRRRLYILPTRYGLLFTVLLAAMLVGSVNYNNNLGFLLTFLLGTMGLTAMVHTYRNLAGLRILSVSAAPVFAGDTAEFHLRVRPEGRSRSALRFTFVDAAAPGLLDAPPWADASVRLALAAPVRGLLKPGRLRVSTVFPVGLFVAWYECRPEAVCPVYPRPIPVNSHRLGGFEGSGRKSGSAGKGAEDFEGLKTYQPGDPIRQISWKTFSRGKGLYRKAFTGQTGAIAVIDWHAFPDQPLERRLSILSGLVMSAHAGKTAYALNLPGNRIPAGSGESHKHKCLLALAVFGEPGEKA